MTATKFPKHRVESRLLVVAGNYQSWIGRKSAVRRFVDEQGKTLFHVCTFNFLDSRQLQHLILKLRFRFLCFSSMRHLTVLNPVCNITATLPELPGKNQRKRAFLTIASSLWNSKKMRLLLSFQIQICSSRVSHRALSGFETNRPQQCTFDFVSFKRQSFLVRLLALFDKVFPLGSLCSQCVFFCLLALSDHLHIGSYRRSRPSRPRVCRPRRYACACAIVEALVLRRTLFI